MQMPIHKFKRAYLNNIDPQCFPIPILFYPNQLYAKIWGKDSLGDVRTVQVHIHNLRGKIEPNPAKPVYLKNVWGKGYIFTPEGQ